MTKEAQLTDSWWQSYGVLEKVLPLFETDWVSRGVKNITSGVAELSVSVSRLSS